jgi:hypothetical protein
MVSTTTSVLTTLDDVVSPSESPNKIHVDETVSFASSSSGDSFFEIKSPTYLDVGE